MEKLAAGPVGRAPGQDDTPRVPIFPPLAGWKSSLDMSSSLCSFWQTRRLDWTVLTLKDSVMFLTQPSVVGQS